MTLSKNSKYHKQLTLQTLKHKHSYKHNSHSNKIKTIIVLKNIFLTEKNLHIVVSISVN